MKSNKGMTLISLMVYIIALAIVIGVISMFTKYFYKNKNETIVSNKTTEQYTMFLTYLTDDINSENVKDLNVDADNINLYFTDGSVHQYAFDESGKKIYYVLYDSKYVKQKQIVLCDNVESSEFSYDSENDKIKTQIVINSITYNNSFNI
jgi:hypothetical protein